MKSLTLRLLLAATWMAGAIAPLAAQQPLHLKTLTPDITDWPGADGMVIDPQFGYALATDGRLLRVGMPWARTREDHMPGANFEYRRVMNDEWQLEHRFAPNFSEFDNAACGFAVGIVDGGAFTGRVVGCPYLDGPGLVNGGVVQLSATYPGGSAGSSPRGGDDNALMGYAISTARASDGTAWAAVGEPGARISLQARGKVHIFQSVGGGWFGAGVLTAGDGAAGDFFGGSVSISVAPHSQLVRVAVGASGHQSSRGAVYVFDRDHISGEWSQIAKRMAPNAQPFDYFGWSVAHQTGPFFEGLHSLLVVGAPFRHRGGDTSLNHRRGTVSVWRQSGLPNPWNYINEGDIEFFCIVPSATCENTQQSMRFGSSLVIDGETVWIGAPRFDASDGTDVGRVYVATFKESIDIWTIDTMLSPGPLSGDCGPLAVAQPGGRFGQALAAVPGGVAVGYPRRGCQLLTFPPSEPGPRWGQVRIYGTPDGIFSDRFE